MSARTNAAILEMLLDNVTDGPWESFGNHVSVPATPNPFTGEYDDDAERSGTLDYYGGDVVCETIERTDAVFVAAAKNLLPEVLEHLRAQDDRIANLLRELRISRAETEEQAEIVTLIRSERYASPTFWLVPADRKSDSSNAFRGGE